MEINIKIMIILISALTRGDAQPVKMKMYGF